MRIYFDNNATTPLDPLVLEAMLPYLKDLFGNPSSAHRFGEEARNGLEQARIQVAALLNCEPARLFFTGGGSESNNTAIRAAVSARPEKKHIITSRVEHSSVLKPLEFLRDRDGYELEVLPVDQQGGLDLDALAAAIRPDTVLVSLMGANNETGVIWPLERIGEICRQGNVLFHCDAVQLVGKALLDMERLAIDYLSIASHKLHGPKGVGALYVKQAAPIRPLIMGAGQENGRRAGTENVAGIVGFAMACALAARHINNYGRLLAPLRGHLEDSVRERVSNVLINGQELPRLANTTSISFENCAAAAMIQELDEMGIAVSAHAACHGGDLDPSHVLTAMAVPETYMHGTLRISLSRYNTMAEVDKFLEIISGVVEKSRRGFAR